jgi:hypothetical protein
LKIVKFKNNLYKKVINISVYDTSMIV